VNFDADVIVVGGGPAGLSFAHGTASAGLATVVLERQGSIGEKVRTSGATHRSTVERLDAPKSLYHQTQSLRIASPLNEARFETDELTILDVRGFYRWLGERAAAKGAELVCNCRVRDVSVDADGATCTATTADGDRTWRARLVVDASGYRAQASRAAGLHAGFVRFGVGAEVEFLAPAVDQREAVLVVGAEDAPAGYGWAFPWGEDRVRVGVGVHHADVRDDPRELLDRLLGHADRYGLDLTGATLTESHHGLIPAEGPAPALVGNGILALGDAGGQASLVAGEGIRVAIWSGEAASEVAVAALQQATVPGKELLAPYERRFRQTFGRELKAGERINRRLAKTTSDAAWRDRIEVAATMPADLVVELLQSRIPTRRLLGWGLRTPRALPRAMSLLRS
jgi:flavin-dependent dehydrogenase